jgi:hypothetical protein
MVVSNCFGRNGKGKPDRLKKEEETTGNRDEEKNKAEEHAMKAEALII